MAVRAEGAGTPAWCDGGLCALVSRELWEALLRGGVRRSHAAGEALLRQGERGTHVLVLVDGRVKVTCLEANGMEVLLAIRGPGEILGEMSALDGGVASATVTALCLCQVHRMTARSFTDFVRGNDDLAVTLLRHSSVRRRESEEMRMELSTLTVAGRLGRMLVRLMDAIGIRTGEGIAVDLGVTQDELARAIGASRSQVAARLAWLRGDGVLTTGRRSVVVRDPARLRRLDSA
jgi:CRP-like cAMP-binding protein